jgi:hypothetical protein
MRFDPVVAAEVAGSDVIRNDGVGRALGHSACRSRRGVPGVDLRAERSCLSMQGSCRFYSGKNVVPDLVFNLMTIG